jgi:hypothetical protein
MGESLRDRIVAVLPRRMPGRLVSVIAAELGESVPDVQAALLEMEGREVLRKGRYGDQRWYRGPFAVGDVVPQGVPPVGLW